MRSFFPSKCVLIVSDDAVYAYTASGNKIELADSVSWNETEFEKKLVNVITDDCNGRPVIILYDTIEQYYRKEQIPPTSALDRGNIIKRKLEFSFPKCEINAALKLSDINKEKKHSISSRVENKSSETIPYLFAAIPSNDNYQRLIDAVRRSMAPIIGIGLLPVESADMCLKLGKKLSKKKAGKSKWLILIGQQHGGGLRQIVIKDGELALTRMTHITETHVNSDMWTEDIVQEIKSSISYLSRFGYSEEDGLEIILLAGENEGENVGERLDVSCRFTSLTTREALSLLGLNIRLEHDEETRTSALYAAWSASKNKLSLKINSQEINNINRKRTISAVMTLVLVASSIYFVYNLQQINTKLENKEKKVLTTETELSRLSSFYEREKESVESSGIDLTLLEGVTTEYKEFTKREIDVLFITKQIGKVFGQQYVIENITYAQKNSEGFKRTRRSVVRNANKLTRGEMPEINKEELYEVKFTMKLSESLGPRKAVGLFRELRDKLQLRLPEHVVEIAKAPTEYGYDAVVKGGTNDVIAKDGEYIAEMSIIKEIESDK